MNVIYEEIRLDPAIRGISVAGSDWTFDPQESVLGHYPTRTAFEIRLDESARGKEMVGAMDYVAHFVAVENGRALPPPDQIERLGREAIVLFLVASGCIHPQEEPDTSEAYAPDGKFYDA